MHTVCSKFHAIDLRQVDCLPLSIGCRASVWYTTRKALQSPMKSIHRRTHPQYGRYFLLTSERGSLLPTERTSARASTPTCWHMSSTGHVDNADGCEYRYVYKGDQEAVDLHPVFLREPASRSTHGPFRGGRLHVSPTIRDAMYVNVKPQYGAAGRQCPEPGGHWDRPWSERSCSESRQHAAVFATTRQEISCICLAFAS
jgi:hypothetical protein